MECKNRITHTIRRGDSLYKIARQYQTTVENILAENPDISAHNLFAGDMLTICPGSAYRPPMPAPVPPPVPGPVPVPAPGYISPAGQALYNDMRSVWGEHIMWTRQLIISIAEGLRDLGATEARLLRNPADMARVFGRYFPAATAKRIEQLFTEHLEIGGRLITAYKKGEASEASELDKRWYANADDIAAFFATIDRDYDRQMIQQMMYRHLDMTKQETAMRLAGKYEADIAAADALWKQAMDMADYFSGGIIRNT